MSVTTSFIVIDQDGREHTYPSMPAAERAQAELPGSYIQRADRTAPEPSRDYISREGYYKEDGTLHKVREMKEPLKWGVGFVNKSMHPVVADSIKKLEALERRTPPGYPLGYKLQRHHYLCQGCGNQTSFAILLTVRRAGSSNKAYSATSPTETIYDLPVETTNTSFVTPRCEACIATLSRVAVPALPAYQAKLFKGTDAKERGEEVVKIDLRALGLLD